MPDAALGQLVRQAFAAKRCMHPDAAPGRCTKIIDAHTVQRARTLESLIDSANHVLTFYPYVWQRTRPLPLQRRGWREASTFTGFCGYHDSATFGPIEREEPPITPEACFLFSYRALCHELFQKLAADQAFPVLLRHGDRGFSSEDQREYQRRSRASAAGLKKAIVDLNAVKTVADTALLRKDYSGWRFLALTFEGPLSLATSGAPTPNRDLSGAPLQVLHDPNSALEHLYVSVVAHGVGVLVVFGWQGHHLAPERWAASLLSLSADVLPSWLVQFVFSHLENVFFSAAWWEGLAPDLQGHVQTLASNSNAYYFPTPFTQNTLVPWKPQSTVRLPVPAAV